MSEDIYTQAMEWRERLLKREAAVVAEMRAAYEDILRVLERRTAELVERLKAASEGEAASFIYQQKQLEQLTRETSAAIEDLASATAERTTQAQRAAVRDAGTEAAGVLNSNARGGQAITQASFNRLPSDVMEQFVGMATDKSPLGESFAELARELGLESGVQIKRAVSEGLAFGWHPTTVARHVRRAVEAKGDNPMRAPAVVRKLNLKIRESIFTAHREATRANYKRAGQKRWRWISTLSVRTCVVCWARHGKEFPVEVPMVKHISCRCVMTPVLSDDKKIESGEEAFAKLETGFQKQLLGEDAYRAYKDGEVSSLADFVGEKESARWGKSLYRRSLKEIKSNRMTPGGGRYIGGWEKGKNSRRDYDPDAIGTPVRRLTVENIKVTPRGVDIVNRHLERFEFDEANQVMVERLRRIAAKELKATRQDLNFYAHELRENVRYKLLGFPGGEPTDKAEARKLWNNAHTATLEDYGITEDTSDKLNNPLYHPDATKFF